MEIGPENASQVSLLSFFLLNPYFQMSVDIMYVSIENEAMWVTGSETEHSLFNWSRSFCLVLY